MVLFLYNPMGIPLSLLLFVVRKGPGVYSPQFCDGGPDNESGDSMLVGSYSSFLNLAPGCRDLAREIVSVNWRETLGTVLDRVELTAWTFALTRPRLALLLLLSLPPPPPSFPLTKVLR